MLTRIGETTQAKIVGLRNMRVLSGRCMLARLAFYFCDDVISLYFPKFGSTMSLRSGRFAANLIALRQRGVQNLASASYHKNVIDHYENPRNVGSLDKNDPNVGTGIVGAPACGDVMKLQIKVDESGKIIDAKFKTFGCGSAIASSSLASEWIKGKTTEYASKVKNDQIAKELCLPPVKLHCSMLAEDAIKAALNDYRRKQKKTAATATH
uniref:Iron-sulfur cluster assembly enzyme ISCU n=2 Tax=Ascaris TaxID=6251 RepID=A0A0M3I588_ASCLU